MIETFKMIQATEIIAKTTVENKINSGNQCREIETIDFLLIQIKNNKHQKSLSSSSVLIIDRFHHNHYKKDPNLQFDLELIFFQSVHLLICVFLLDLIFFRFPIILLFSLLFLHSFHILITIINLNLMMMMTMMVKNEPQ